MKQKDFDKAEKEYAMIVKSVRVTLLNQTEDVYKKLSITALTQGVGHFIRLIELNQLKDQK